MILISENDRNDGKLVGKVLRINQKAPPLKEFKNKLKLDVAGNYFLEDPDLPFPKPVYISPSDLNTAGKPVKYTFANFLKKREI